jgi:hypothetical protein
MKKMVRHYYFAYGSNMNLAQMQQRGCNPRVLGIARLPGYRITFHGNSAIWDGAQETVVADEQGEVWGVVYQLTFADCEQLDMYQDVRFDGTGPYFHYPVDVITATLQPIDAMMYKKAILGKPELPSTEYVNFIVQGAKEQGLPEAYITSLQQMQTVAATYAVPLMRKSKLSYMSANCGDCG